jgi:hypothetical protein
LPRCHLGSPLAIAAFPDSVRKHLVRLALNLWLSRASIQNNPQVQAENYRPVRRPAQRCVRHHLNERLGKNQEKLSRVAPKCLPARQVALLQA